MAAESRFNRFRTDAEFPDLFKPEPGEHKVGRLTGDRVHHGKDNRGEVYEVPVLDLVDRHGVEWSFMSGAWRWLDALSLADPHPGDVVRISRHPDIGQSRDLRIEVLQRAEQVIAKSDIPTDPAPPAPADTGWTAQDAATSAQNAKPADDDDDLPF